METRKKVMKSEKEYQEEAIKELQEFVVWALEEISRLVMLRDHEAYFHLLLEKFYEWKKKHK